MTAIKTNTGTTYDTLGTLLSSHTVASAASSGAGTVVNYVCEPNGSVAMLRSAAGATIGAYDYAPYGETTNTLTDAAQANPFRYISGIQDGAAGGDHGPYKLGARYYDTHSHFTQPDAIAGTITDPKTLNSYGYAGSDPINSAYLSGFFSLDDLGDFADDFFTTTGDFVGAAEIISCGVGYCKGAEGCGEAAAAVFPFAVAIGAFVVLVKAGGGKAGFYESGIPSAPGPNSRSYRE